MKGLSRDYIEFRGFRVGGVGLRYDLYILGLEVLDLGST